MKIKADLSVSSLDDAINRLTKYKNTLNDKSEKLVDTVANEVANLAQSRFNSAVVEEDFVNKITKIADVDVSVVKVGDSRMVVASGEDAVFVEFGAGVHFNGSVGQSRHPKGKELGLTIGSYGLGKGSQDSWFYYLDEDKGAVAGTHGTLAVMPMYLSSVDVMDNVGKIAKEIFKDD